MDNIKCEYCGEIYTETGLKWCKPCETNKFKKNFTNWTSGNEKIDDFIQEMQLKFEYNGSLFEWIQYNQFDKIKEVGKGGFATVYSAIWKNGSLHYNKIKKEWIRKSNQKVALKCLYNNSITSFLNKVWILLWI